MAILTAEVIRISKVEITGVDTSRLKTLTEEQKQQLLRRVKAGDSAAKEELILGNLRLVLSVIGRFNPKRDSMDDLFQVGCIGLIKAINNFNLDLGVCFSTYCVPMIIGEIRRYQRDNSPVRVSRSVRDLAYRALQVKERALADEGRELSPSELASRLSVSEKQLGEAMEAIIEPLSLFDSVFGDGEDKVYVIDKLADEEDTVDGWVENMTLNEALKKLNEREKRIVRLRFYKGRTQMEIADEIGISQAQVSRIEKGAVDKLRKYMS